MAGAGVEPVEHMVVAVRVNAHTGLEEPGPAAPIPRPNSPSGTKRSPGSPSGEYFFPLLLMSQTSLLPRLEKQEMIDMRGFVAWILGLGLAANGLAMLVVPMGRYCARGCGRLAVHPAFGA
jgi:hypothetical protein